MVAQPALFALLAAGLSGPWRVLWVVADSARHLLPPLPPSFRVVRWAPQAALLRSGALALFVSHCGANSVSEAPTISGRRCKPVHGSA